MIIIIIFWIFPIVSCRAFYMWHWPIGKDLDLSFNWDHHHLHLAGIWMVSRPADHFITCRYTVLTRPSKVETAVHGYNSWLSVWTLSCRCPVMALSFVRGNPPCINVCYWKMSAFSLPVGPRHMEVNRHFLENEFGDLSSFCCFEMSNKFPLCTINMDQFSVQNKKQSS